MKRLYSEIRHIQQEIKEKRNLDTSVEIKTDGSFIFRIRDSRGDTSAFAIFCDESECLEYMRKMLKTPK